MMMTRISLVLAALAALLTGCTTPRVSGYDGLDMAPAGNYAVESVPVVHIKNRHWAAADVYLDGVRLATVGGLTGERTIALQPYQIAQSGNYVFHVHLVSYGDLELGPVGFLPGKRILLEIQPNGAGSMASLE